MKDYGDKISADDKSHIEKELETLKEAIKGKDKDKIKHHMDSLQKASHKLAEEVYKSTASQQAGGSQAEGSADHGTHSGGADSPHGHKGESKSDKNDDVIDADFKAEDDKK